MLFEKKYATEEQLNEAVEKIETAIDALKKGVVAFNGKPGAELKSHYKTYIENLVGTFYVNVVEILGEIEV